MATAGVGQSVQPCHEAIQTTVLDSALGLRQLGHAVVAPVVLPLSDAVGLHCLTLPMLQAGATVSLHRRFDSNQVLADMAERRATHFLAHAGTWRTLLDNPRTYQTDTTSLQLGVVMARLSAQALARLRKAFPNADIVGLAGEGETTPVNRLR